MRKSVLSMLSVCTLVGMLFGCGGGGSDKQMNGSNSDSVQSVSPNQSSKVFTVNPIVGGNGSVSPNGLVSVSQGSTASFSILPNSGYALDNYYIDNPSYNSCGGHASGNIFSTAAVTNDCSVNFNFIPSAEGYWAGNISTSAEQYPLILVVLDNGDTWGIEEINSTTYKLFYGTTNLTSKSGDSPLYGTWFYPLQTRGTSYQGSFVPNSTLNFFNPSTVSTVTTTYDSTYDQPASLPQATGSYDGVTIIGSSTRYTPVTISSSGTFSYTDSGCTGYGTVKPRATGKNVFDLSVKFSGSSCVLGNGTIVAGIAVYDNTEKALIAMAIDNSKSIGFLLVGWK